MECRMPGLPIHHQLPESTQTHVRWVGDAIQPYMWDSKRDTDVKNRLLDSVGEGEGGMIWKNSIETCVLSYVK